MIARMRIRTSKMYTFSPTVLTMPVPKFFSASDLIR